MKSSLTQSPSLFSPLAAGDPEAASGDLDRAEPRTEGAWILDQTPGGVAPSGTPIWVLMINITEVGDVHYCVKLLKLAVGGDSR